MISINMYVIELRALMYARACVPLHLHQQMSPYIGFLIKINVHAYAKKCLQQITAVC